MADYVTPAELATALGKRDSTDPRLARVCAAASDAIDIELGRTTRFTAPPPIVAESALSLAVDVWKQPDATFGVLGLNETGPVRVGRDLVARYLPVLIGYHEPAGWGVG